MDRPSVSWLFVPADRPERFEKATASGADETILDLEDAVAPEAKLRARENVVAWLGGGGVGWVRLNAAGTPWHDDDVEAVVGCSGLRGVMVPKAESSQVLASIASRLRERRPGRSDFDGSARGGRVQIVALVETALGIRDVDTICSAPGVKRLAFGSVDLALDIDAQDDDEALRYARSAMVIASRAAGLQAPIDGVTIEFGDTEVVAAAARRSRALGFGGKLCIHPAQIHAVNAAFLPSSEELEWALRVVEAGTERAGAFSLESRMVDGPLLERARRLLASAGQR